MGDKDKLLLKSKIEILQKYIKKMDNKEIEFDKEKYNYMKTELNKLTEIK